MEEKNLYLMEKAPVKEGLLKLGIPTIVGMLMIGFYNFVDSYFVAQLGTHPMGAMSVSFPLMTLMPGIGLFIGNGASALISELLGAKEKEKAEIVLSSSFLYLIFFSLASLLFYPFLDKLMVFLGASEAVLPYALDYGRILVISFVFHIPSVAMTNLVRAEGATRLSAVSQVVGSLINIILDPILIFQFNMGIKGAAIATAIAQFVSFCILLNYYLSGKSYLKIHLKKAEFQSWVIKPILYVGLPLFAVNLFQSISMSLSNVLAAAHSDEVLAAMGIVSRLITMVTLGITGFSRGYQTYASYHYGADNLDRVEDSTQMAYRWTMIASVIITGVMILLRKPLLSAFSEDQSVLWVAQKAIVAQSLFLFAYGFQAIGIVYLLVRKHNTAGFVFSIMRQGLVFIPTVYLLDKIFSVSGLLWSQSAADIISATLLIIYLRLQVKRSVHA